VTASRESLIDATTDALQRLTGDAPAWRWFVPGRVEIVGKHTDYAGGRSLVAAVSRGFVVAAAPRADGIVRVVDARAGERVELSPDDETAELTGWRRYIGVVARRLARNFPGAPLGADIALASDLPRAAGVSSSSALVVGVATALVRRGRLDERAEWRAAIATPLDLAGYLGAVESGLTFGALAGTAGVGIHGGSEDHTAILTSRADMVSAYAYVPVRHLASETMPPDWRFVIMTSGVHAAKAGRTRDQYNRASNATRALAALGAPDERGAPRTLAGMLASAPGAEAWLRERLVDGSANPTDAAWLARRLDHFIREDARVLPAAVAFRGGDAAALGELSRASQEDADVLLGNQVEETRRLAALARAGGAFAASSFGAGFGGSVWALVHAGDADAFLDRWRRAFVSAFPARRGADGFVTRPAAGLTDLAS